MGQKDLSEKILVAYDDVFADIVNVLLLKRQYLIRPEELEDRGTKDFYKSNGMLHELERDVVKRWKKGDVRLACIGIENQTAADPDMALRVIGYDGAAYREQLLDKKERNERYPVITMVLYFGYRRRWDKPLTILEQTEVPEVLEAYVNDYKVNLFEVAYLSDEQVAMFQSDFRIVADYFVQKRKYNEYTPSQVQMQHVDAVLQLLSIMENDKRFEAALYKNDGKKVENMCDVLDIVEQRGEKRGIERGVAEIMRALYQNGYTEKQIAQMTNREVLEVKGMLQLI